jgi:hypothetical protein
MIIEPISLSSEVGVKILKLLRFIAARLQILVFHGRFSYNPDDVNC